MKFENGWRYSDNGNFRERFPEIELDPKDGAGILFIHCEELIEGRWEGFIANPNWVWTEKDGWQKW